MSFITTQQAKLDLELVPKEKRLVIGKCNERLNPGQDFDALPTDEEIVSFLRELRYTREINSLNDVVVDHMHQPWRTFAALINKSFSRKTTDKTLSRRNKIGMHTSRDDYLINTLRFVFAKEETQIYGVVLPESLTSPEMKETQAYKTYLEPTRKSKTVKRPTKKSTGAPSRGVVIRETHEMPLTKKKEKVDVTQGKGIELLSQVALTEGAQFEEVQRKSMRDFHKTRPSGSGTVNKTDPSAAEIKPSVTNEGTDDSNNGQDSSGEDSDQENDSDDDKTQSDNENESDSKHETDESESGSESNHEEDEDDEEELKDEFVKTPSNDSNDEDGTKIMDKAGVDTDKGFVQKEGIDAAMTNTGVLVTSSSHLSDLAAKFLNFLDIPHTDAEIVSPMDVHVHHEVPSQQTPTLFTVHVSNIFDSSPVFSIVIPQSLPSFTPPPQQSTSTLPPTTEATNPPSTLPDFTSVFQFNNRVTTLEQEVVELKKDPLHTQSGSSKGDKSQSKSSGKSVQSEEPEFEVANSYLPQDQEENPGNDDEEPKEKVASKRDRFTKPTQPQEPTDPDWNVGKTPQQGQNQSWLMTLASSAKKPSKTFAELMSTPIDFSAFIMNGLNINNLTQETLLGPAFRLLKDTRSNYAELEYDLKNATRLFQKNLIGRIQKAYLQGGVSTMTYTTSLTKTKAAQYDLPGIKDMVANIWSPVKVAYDKHALWGISHWRDQLTRVEVMKKHGYGYLREIDVRRAGNNIYTFKECDFPRLRINDIEDVLILIVHNRLTNLLGDDVSDFAIALRMFTRSIVIQKRVEDLQLAVESYQKKINVTKPETTKPGVRKRDPYTPYQDPQGFIYVDDNKRNRLMRSDELYKFSVGTLTRVRTSLDDITKNIRMEYLPKRRWITLEKKRANIMIKAIDK
nr:hypothetical protein [Tanacetum cinerariifolium]